MSASTDLIEKFRAFLEEARGNVGSEDNYADLLSELDNIIADELDCLEEEQGG